MGREIKKKRPWLVVTSQQLERAIRTVIVVSMTTGGPGWISAPSCVVALDQLLTIDASRVLKVFGSLDQPTRVTGTNRLRQMCAG